MVGLLGARDCGCDGVGVCMNRCVSVESGGSHPRQQQQLWFAHAHHSRPLVIPTKRGNSPQNCHFLPAIDSCKLVVSFFKTVSQIIENIGSLQVLHSSITIVKSFQSFQKQWPVPDMKFFLWPLELKSPI